MTESTRITVQGLPPDQVGQFISQYLATSNDVARDCEEFKALLPPAVEASQCVASLPYWRSWRNAST